MILSMVRRNYFSTCILCCSLKEDAHLFSSNWQMTICTSSHKYIHCFKEWEKRSHPRYCPNWLRTLKRFIEQQNYSRKANCLSFLAGHRLLHLKYSLSIPVMVSSLSHPLQQKSTRNNKSESLSESQATKTKQVHLCAQQIKADNRITHNPG